MPIAISCQCGKQLRLKDELAGKKIKCPGCQQVLTVTGPKSVADPVTSKKAAEPPVPKKAGDTLHGLAQPTISLVCECGKKLNVKSEHAGKKVKCPGCQKVLAVPAPAEPSAPPWVDPSAEPPAPAPADGGFDFSSFTNAPAAPPPAPPPPRAKKEEARSAPPPPPPPEPAAQEEADEDEQPRRFKEKTAEGSNLIFVGAGLLILVLLFIPLIWLLFFRDADPGTAEPTRPAPTFAEVRPTAPWVAPKEKPKPPEPKEELPKDLVLPLPIPKLERGGDVAGDVPTLIKQLDDPAAEERKLAAMRLGRHGDAAKPAIKKLEQTLADEDPDVALQAALALIHIGTVEGLVKGLKDGQARVRIVSAMGLATERVKLPKQAVPPLIVALKDPDAKVRAYAAAAFWKMEVDAEPAEAALIAQLADKDDTARLYAVMALAYTVVTRDEAVAPLTTLLADAPTRAPAAAALAKLGPKAAPAVPQLTPLLQDPLPGIRINAAIALGAIGPAAKSAVPALVDNLKDNSSLVRTFTLRALAKIGPAAQEAVPAILPLLKESNQQNDAADALKKIDPAAAQKAGVP